MRVFIGFGYNDRDQWIKDLVFPIVEAFGHETVTGEDLLGQPIQNGVADRIDRSHALIGFLTRRDRQASGVWTTHRWVSDELAHAAAKQLLIMEVRESGVDPQGGIVGDRQRLEYDENRRDAFIVDLVKGLGSWPRGSVRLQLLGDNLHDQLVPILRRAEFRCQYRLNVEGEETDPQSARVQPLKGGLFIDLKDLPPGGLIQVELTYQNRVWISNFESMDSHNIRLIQG